MIMAFAISSPNQYNLFGNNIGNGVLEVRLLYLERMICVSPISGHPPRILHESTRIPFHNALFYLSFRELQDPLFYTHQFLSSLNVRPDSCETIARKIASFIVHMSNETRERNTNFYIIADVDFVQSTWMEEPIDSGVLVEETVVFDEAPPPRRGVAEATVERMRKLKAEENGEKLGDCSICLDELSCEKEEVKVIRIPCGHVYHKSCIFKWLKNHNSCPLCRCPLPLLEDPN